MEQPTRDDDQPRSSQVLYRSVEEKFKAVQDEVSALKAEVQQTLIDLREFMTKGHAISSPLGFDAPEEQNNLSPQVSAAAPPSASPDPGPAPVQRYSETAPQNPQDNPRNVMDVVMMGHIIRWLGTVVTRGLPPGYLKPFLQAYEESGRLTSTMAQLIYKSLEDLDGARGGQPNQSFSPSEYSACLQELNEIICNPGYASAS